ncbi:hypothetical protein [Streptomyces sp. ODS28]|uniref:hypothetical protein n=1 Tax=Streptomyces sp. ODS28 TaxID=3136688 RepID=UPI0031E51BEA
MVRRISVAVAVVGLACAVVAPSPSYADPLPVRGWGWKLTSQLGVTSLSPSRQYTVTFATAAMKKRYTPYLTAAVAQVNAAGVHLEIGGVERVDVTRCGPVGHIQLTEAYRPLDGKPGYSRGAPCPRPARGVGAGGAVAVDSEYWDGTWHIENHKLRNTIVHELLHALGLDHPNTDLDGNGRTTRYECPKTPEGDHPVMCSPNGGHRTPLEAGRLLPYDIKALKTLVANAKRQGIE